MVEALYFLPLLFLMLIASTMVIFSKITLVEWLMYVVLSFAPGANLVVLVQLLLVGPPSKQH